MSRFLSFKIKRAMVILMMALGVLFVPHTMQADNASELAVNINNFTGGGTGAFFATADGNTVTVTGALAGVSSALSLNISAGVQVMWKANIEMGISFSGGSSLIMLSGGGTFYVSGSVVAANNIIAVESVNAKIVVSDAGKVQAANACAISTNGNVEVQNTAQVSSLSTKAIEATGASSVVTISGGTVSNAATSANESVVFVSNTANTELNVVVSGSSNVQAMASGNAIRTFGKAEVSGMAQVSAVTGIAISAEGVNSVVTVNGGTVSNAATQQSNAAIFMNNASNVGLNVIVSGNGKVQTSTASAGVAIRTFGDVEVKEDAQVSVTGTTGIAIYASGENATITISDNAILSAASGEAIWTLGDNATVEITGGEVKSATGAAIVSLGTNATVIINGGMVSNATTNSNFSVVFMNNPNNIGTNVTVNGTGSIVAQNAGNAIRTSGRVVVRDAAQVIASTGHAIYATGSSSTVRVNGGIVFAYGSAIVGSGNVICLPNNPAGFSNATGIGVVIAWDKEAGNAHYAMLSTTDLYVSGTATACWSTNEGVNGIFYYINSTNIGFIPQAVSLEEIPFTPTEDDFYFELARVYNGEQQAIGLIIPGFDEITGGELTLTYTGVEGTIYTPSNVPPTNAGTYAITVDISGGTLYEAAEITLRENYVIAKKAVIVKADDYTINAGAPLPTPTFSYSGFIAPDSEDNAIATQAELRLNVSNSDVAGASFIYFSTKAVLNNTNGTNYTLDHQNGILTIEGGEGVAAILQPNVLKASLQDGILYLSGLRAGDTWSMYNMLGTLIYQGIATGDVVTWHAAFLQNGMYIILSGNKTVKIMNN